MTKADRTQERKLSRPQASDRRKESPELSPEALDLLEQALGTSNTGRT